MIEASIDHSAYGQGRSTQIFFKKRKDFLPAVDCLLLAVCRTMIIKETMTGAIISMEFIILAVLLKFGFVLIYLLRRRVAIVIAEYSQDGAGEISGVIQRRDREIGIQILRLHHHPSAPTIDDRIEA